MNELVIYKDSYAFQRIKCKVAFYNSCWIFRKLLFCIIHGRNFVPTQYEKFLVKKFASQEDKRK